MAPLGQADATCLPATLAGSSQPTAAVHGLQFLVEVGRRCPLTLAAGLDCGGVADLLGETVLTLAAKPAATAKKLALEFMSGLVHDMAIGVLSTPREEPKRCHKAARRR